MKKEIIFTARNLAKTYQSGTLAVAALQAVNLEISAGAFIVLLGPSGSGKSTLLNILGGLDSPSSGDIYFQDQALTHATEAELTRYRRNSIGFVFQFYNLIPNLTAVENVELGSSVAPNPMSATEALALLGLADRCDHFPAELSGGQQQRVAIARALAKRPAVLLCDEPTGALDCVTGKVVLEALQKANQQFQTTVIVVTHNVVIGQMADQIIHVADGKIHHVETPTHKLSPAELEW